MDIKFDNTDFVNAMNVTFCFDLDGVINFEELGSKELPSSILNKWTEDQWREYFWNTKPNTEVIELMRTLSTKGHTIKIFTARYESMREVTERWLKQYSVPYTELQFNKPLADVYIDDKGIRFSGFSDLIKTLKKDISKGKKL